jgi:hypothetical protein
MNLFEIAESLENIEPETIRNTFPLLTDLEVEKLQVISLLRNTRAAYEDLHVFENAVLTLNSISPDTAKMEGCEPKHIWKAIGIINTLHKDIELSHEVLMYIKYVFNDHGLWFYPSDIGLDNPILEDVSNLAANGPFPLNEDHLGIQAFHYLSILEYMKRGNN